MRILRTTGNLPTGKWLAKQREEHSHTIDQIANAVHWHPLSVRFLETRNRVIPPGWKKALGELGIKLSMPAWPRTMPAYSGADLKRDMDIRAGMRHSNFWLSNQLGVPEEEISTLVQCNLPVPQAWLLKLAELGADVPELVRVTLFRPYVDAPHTAAAPVELDASKPQPASHAEKQNTPLFWVADEPDSEIGAERVKSTSTHEGSDKRPTERAGSDEPQKKSLFVSWTDEAGLHISLSTALLGQIPTALIELLLALSPSSQPKSTHAGLPGKPAEPSGG